jgi:hypothetical protein
VAQLDTGQDILAHVIRRAGEILPTDTSVANADHLIDAKLYIQSAYWDICALKPWRWARKRTQFASLASYTGTIGSISDTSVTLGSAIASSVAEYKFIADSDGIPHRISAHTAATTAVTLATSYTGDATSGNYTIFQDEITVASDIMAFPIIKELHWGDSLVVIPEGEMEKMYPRNIWGSTTSKYATFITDTKIRISPWPLEARLFECSYNYRPDPLTWDGVALTDTPIVPRDSRIAIAQRALAKIYADKRDARVEVVQAELDETLAKMSASDTTFGKPRIRPNRGSSVSGF